MKVPKGRTEPGTAPVHVRTPVEIHSPAIVRPPVVLSPVHFWMPELQRLITKSLHTVVLSDTIKTLQGLKIRPGPGP